jgi:hypothetical protein
MEESSRRDIEKALATGKNVPLRLYMDLLSRVSGGGVLTPSELLTFRQLKKELEQELEAAAPPSLPSQTAVVSYLKAQGYRTSTSTIGRYYSNGILKSEADGTFIIAKVEAFAQEHLKRRDGSQKGVVDEAYKLRIAEETRKLSAQADHWQIRAKEAAGELVPRSFAHDEIAAREIVFKSDLTNWIYTGTPVECTLFEGSQDKIPDVIQLKLAALDKVLARFVGDHEYTVELPPPKPAEPAPVDLEAEFEEDT